MVNLVFTVVSLAVLVVAMVTRGIAAPSPVVSADTAVLSAAIQESPASVPNETPIGQLPPSSTPVPTTAPAAEIMQSSSPSPTALPTDEWIYIGSVSDRSETDSAVSFTTSDSVKAVTDWYRARLKSLSLNVTNDIQTRKNQQVANTLVGISTIEKVSIEITQEDANDMVHATVTVITSPTATSTSINNSI